MRAIVRAIESGALRAEARIVVSNKRDSGALAFARDHSVPARFIPTLSDPAGADNALSSALEEAGVELVVLSGYLRKLGPRTLGAYPNRILNIHPGPLPRFGGQGMYGRRVHEAVAAAGVSASGACVHIVDSEYDHGPAVASLPVPLAQGDDAEAIERKVAAAEPPFFVDVLSRIASGELKLP